MAEEAKWYVVHTYSGYENKVADSIVNAVENRQLHDFIYEVKVPTEMVTEIKDNQTREVKKVVILSGWRPFIRAYSKPVQTVCGEILMDSYGGVPPPIPSIPRKTLSASPSP